MSKTLFTFLLSELATVRVHCKACGLVAECGLDRLDKIFGSGDCPHCKAELASPVNNQLVALARVLRQLDAAKAQVEIEFVLPQPPAARAE